MAEQLKMTVEQFADLFDLKLVVEGQYRPNDSHTQRWTAKFERVTVKGEGVEISEYGVGTTPERAIENYGTLITGKTLYVDRPKNGSATVFCRETIEVKCLLKPEEVIKESVNASA